jgi:transposase
VCEENVAFRDLSVVVIQEVLRRWKNGDGLRTIAAATGTDRKTVRRYVEAARARGLSRGDGGRALDQEVLGEVVADVLPGAPSEVGESRTLCRANKDRIAEWVADGCRAPKVVRLLHQHTGVLVPERTLSRFIAEEVAPSGRGTVCVTPSAAGEIVEVDFMEVGRVELGGVRTRLFALVCVAAFSRHTFVWPCLGTSGEDVIAGLEAAWRFFGGVFRVVVTDNPRPIVDRPDPLKPVFNEAFLEYSQARGFVVDLARVRHPQDKPRVERTVQYVRSDGFAGERLVDLEHARRHIARWCSEIAGKRVHGTMHRRPIDAFEDERPKLLPAPTEPYDPPTWVELKVGRDTTVAVARAIYSVPHAYVGRRLRVRYDRTLVKFYDGGTVVKVHPRAAAGTAQIDAQDLPPGRGELATRDAESLQTRAARAGGAVGTYAHRLLEGPLPWTRVRHVNHLLRLCRSFGDADVDAACAEALALNVVDVTRVGRMLALKGPRTQTPTPPSAAAAPPHRVTRFGRDPREFGVRAGAGGTHDAT